MYSTEITIPSNRIYFDDLDPEELKSLLATQHAYGRAREMLYNIKYNAQFLGKDSGNDTALIKSLIFRKFGLAPQDYYITSLQSHAGGMLRSQKELEKVRKEEYAARLEARKKKLKSLRRRLTMCRKVKDSLIKRSRLLKASGKPGKPYVPADFRSILPQKSETDGEAVYKYEIWIDKEIRRVSARISLIEEKAKNDESRNNRIPRRITFGTRDFYRSKDKTDISPEEWHSVRNRARNHMILFSGRYDAGSKNWLVRYNPSTLCMDITMMDSTVLHIKNVSFPYRGDELKAVLSHKKEKGWSVGYWMDFRTDRKGKDYIIMKASFTVYGDGRVNDCTETGVISVDMNLDNLAVSELDGEGHLLHREEIRFNLEGLSSHQVDDVLGRACSRVVSLCVKTKKPLVMENIDLVKKSASLAYGNNKTNRGTRMFAYSKMTAFLKGKALRNSVGVINVNPAYTSLTGKAKYMKGMKAPVHAAASYVIGRRGMGFMERTPGYLEALIPENIVRSHHWKKASALYRLLKDIPPKKFLSELPLIVSKEMLKEYKPSYV